MPRQQRTSLLPLAAIYAALVVYASLYPFSAWRQPGMPVLAFVLEAWPRWWTPFDLISNLLGYLPLGALVCGALLRHGQPRLRALVISVAAGSALSAAMEVLQNFLPARVPSNLDWALNTLGVLAGALLAETLHAFGWIGRWQAIRERWFIASSSGGLTLLLLWPTALFFPAPLPLGLGHVFDRVRELAVSTLDGTSLEGWIAASTALPQDPLPPGLELIAIAIGLLVPCLLAYAISAPTWRRAVLVFGAVLLGALATTLSTAMSFGPQHAFAWVTAATPLGWAIAVLAALAMILLPPRAAAALGLLAIAAMVALVNDAPADPYFSQNLFGWEQGRFIRFHGLSQWIGWLWPYVTLLYLLLRATAREDSGAKPRAPKP
jgi:VanZ family protein